MSLSNITHTIRLTAYETPSSNVAHLDYYKMGGKILTPKDILNNAALSEYKGYREEDIEKANKLVGISRTDKLRAIKGSVIEECKDNLAEYLQAIRNLRYELKTGEPSHKLGKWCTSTGSVFLKHNHLFNDFAHLLLISEYLSEQPDLFDF